MLLFLIACDSSPPAQGPAPHPSVEDAQRAVDAAIASGTRADAQAVAEQAAACGSCHQAEKEGPSFPGEPLPTGEDRKGHMHRHRWAVDRMWEGLVAHDAGRWQSGAFALLEEPLDEGRPWTKSVHDLGREGVERADDAARVRIFADLLATCAACHQEAGQGPTP
jgi:cytochrome c553